MATAHKPLPRIGSDTKPFWDGAKAGKIRLPWCTACGKPHWPAGPVCPFCLAETIEWRDASGRGTVATFTVVHKAWFPSFAADIPDRVAQVELHEGPRITASVMGTPPAAVTIGMAVEAVFDPVTPYVTLPRFRPVG